MGAGHRHGVYGSDHKRSHGKSRSSSSWLQPDPEARRKKRVAKYKVFAVEGKVKQTVRDGCRWIKEKYLEVRYSWF